MKLTDLLRLIWLNLWRMKVRTILTATGVAIGTTAIMTMVSLALGLKQNAVNSVERFGKVTEIQVMQKWESNGQTPKRITDSTVAELESIPGVVGVMPRQGLNAGTRVEVGRLQSNGNVSGFDFSQAQTFQLELAEGRYPNSNKEVLISYDYARYLERKASKHRGKTEVSGATFGGPAMEDEKNWMKLLNKSVTVFIERPSGNGSQLETRKLNFKIVGRLAEGVERGPIIYLPIKTVQDLNKWVGVNNNVAGQERRNRGENVYENLTVKIVDRTYAESVTQEIENLGYQGWSQMQALKEIDRAFLIIEAVLGGIGGISLLIASIGIMNTMIMSILERTREIGIMKVIGATVPNIRTMFLFEAGGIGLLGGIVGLLIGYGLSALINLIPIEAIVGDPDFKMTSISLIPWWLASFAVVFSMVIGVLSGIYPAMRAAKLSPLAAIRQE